MRIPGSIRCAMRITHIDNIPHILKYGIVRRDSDLASPDYRSIGNESVISKRNLRPIAGTDLKIGDGIPFYFGPRSPMLYCIQNGCCVNMVNKSEIIYLIIKIQDIIKNGFTAYFSDGNASSLDTSIFKLYSLEELNRIVSIADVYDDRWGAAYDFSCLKRNKKQAELIVFNDMPPSIISYYAVSCSETRDRIIEIGVRECMVSVRPDFYY